VNSLWWCWLGLFWAWNRLPLVSDMRVEIGKGGGVGWFCSGRGMRLALVSDMGVEIGKGGRVVGYLKWLGMQSRTMLACGRCWGGSSSV
jgi:hypothetical protein